MKISKLLKKVVKEEGSHSRNSKTIVKLQLPNRYTTLNIMPQRGSSRHLLL